MADLCCISAKAVVFSVFFYPFILIFGELLVIKTYGLCAKEMKARTVIHTVSSAMIAVPSIILLCLDFTEFVKRGSFWWHYPLAVFCLDAIVILIVITVFKRRKKSEVN